MWIIIVIGFGLICFLSLLIEKRKRNFGKFSAEFYALDSTERTPEKVEEICKKHHFEIVEKIESKIVVLGHNFSFRANDLYTNFKLEHTEETLWAIPLNVYDGDKYPSNGVFFKDNAGTTFALCY